MQRNGTADLGIGEDDAYERHNERDRDGDTARSRDNDLVDLSIIRRIVELEFVREIANERRQCNSDGQGHDEGNGIGNHNLSSLILHITSRIADLESMGDHFTSRCMRENILFRSYMGGLNFITLQIMESS